MSDGFAGAIFDVDGVLVDSPHEQAWRESLRELMEGEWSGLVAETTWAPDRFTSQLYQERVSGKPRMDGATAVLDYFHVPDPATRLDEYAERKQAMILELIKAGEFRAYDDALRFVLAVDAAGIPLAAASSSHNAGLMLGAIRMDAFAERTGLPAEHIRPGQTLLEMFRVDISGRHVGPGKPAPGIFLQAATELGVEPERCFVVEDASNGVRAAKAGGMRALGLARHDDQALLEAEQADIVVTSLDEIDLDALGRGELAGRTG